MGVAQVCAIVLAGGRAGRLAGVAKPALIGPDGRTALRIALDVCSGVVAGPIAVVGPPAEVKAALGTYAEPITVVQEDPPKSGPARGIAAGMSALAATPCDAVLVLACDMPNAGAAVRVLVEAGVARDGVVAHTHGRHQWLLGLYRPGALAAACARLPQPVPGARDASVYELMAGLDLVGVPVPDEAAADLDTPGDLDRLGFSAPGEPSRSG